jgi:hypothetical protein
MGPGIGLALAMGGIRTTLISRTAERAAHGLEKARAQGSMLIDNELAGTAEMERAMELLDGSTDFDQSVARAGLVVESGPEDWRGGTFCAHGRLAAPDAGQHRTPRRASAIALAARTPSAR